MIVLCYASRVTYTVKISHSACIHIRLSGWTDMLNGAPHRLRRLLVCMLCTEMLQDLLEVAEVDVVAIDLKDDLARLKTRCSCLPAYRQTDRQ